MHFPLPPSFLCSLSQGPQSQRISVPNSKISHMTGSKAASTTVCDACQWTRCRHILASGIWNIKPVLPGLAGDSDPGCWRRQKTKKENKKGEKEKSPKDNLPGTDLYAPPLFFLSSSITSNGVHEKQTEGQIGNSSEIRSIHLPQLIFINYMSSKLRPCLFSSTGSIALSRREDQASGSVMWSSGWNPKHTVKDVNSMEFNEHIAHPNKYNCLFQGKGISF